MKPFTKRLALVMGLLFTALLCLGVVFIDTTQNYWRVSGGFVQLVVSNQTNQAVFTVDTNTFRVGFNTNNTARSFVVQGQKPATNNAAGNGTTAATTGTITLIAGTGGTGASTNSVVGGAAGTIFIEGGAGGVAPNSTTNATGGVGGTASLRGGAGGSANSVATNLITGGAGGSVFNVGGAGGAPNFGATNTAGGGGGGLQFTGGAGGTPSAGWSRFGGFGGAFSFSAGAGGSGTRTNGGDGGNVVLTAGAAGSVLTAPGDPGLAGNMTLTAGAGGTGDSNGIGGSVYLVPGPGGSTARSGDVVVGRNAAASTVRGGLMVGPLVATSGSLTNLLSITATLDFPSIAAGTVADLPVAFAGAADGDVVTLGVPLSSVTNCTWMGFSSNAVVYVRAANGQPVTAQDPNSGVFRITVEKFR